MSDLVRAIRAGFYPDVYREPGETFAVPAGAKASWWRLADGSEDDVSEELAPKAKAPEDEPVKPKKAAPKKTAEPFADAPEPVVVTTAAPEAPKNDWEI